MRRLAAIIRRFGRTLLRMEVMLLVLLLAMTVLGRATDLDARIKLVLSDAVRDYHAGRAITALDEDAPPPARDGRATAALPVGR